MRITNKELYDKLEIIETGINKLNIAQAVTNNKIKFHDKALYGLAVLIIIVIGWLVLAPRFN